MTDKISIAQCPFCGSSDVDLGGEEFETSYIECQACYARGPLAFVGDRDTAEEHVPLEGEAIQSWSLRIAEQKAVVREAFDRRIGASATAETPSSDCESDAFTCPSCGIEYCAMGLRDQVAMHVLQGLIAAGRYTDAGFHVAIANVSETDLRYVGCDLKTVIRDSLFAADAFLEERSK